MSGLRFCDAGGLLVYAAGRLPTDPCEHYLEAITVRCGCNQMRCRQCGERVRSGPPGRGLPSGRALTAAELFAAERWEDLTASAPAVRLYACRCALWECWLDAQVIDRERESPVDPHTDWACAGHPVPELPTRLGELELRPDSDWAAVVAEVLGGVCPRALQLIGRPDGAALWLGWLYAYLQGRPEADALSVALAARVGDSESPDPIARGRVLHFFARFPKAAGFDRLIAEAERAPEAVVVGFPIPEDSVPPTLFDVIVGRLEGAPRRTTDALHARTDEVLRRALLTSWSAGPGEVDVVARALKRFSGAFRDPALRLWMADHAVAIAAAEPGRWRALMDLLADYYQKPALGHLLVIAGVALIQSGAIPLSDVRTWLDTARTRELWVDDAWLMPLRSVLDDEARKLAAN